VSAPESASASASGTGSPVLGSPALEPIDAPFDQYQRYRITSAIARALAENAARSPRVLDVGGHHADFWGVPHRPIADFLPDVKTVTIDLASNPLAGYVRGRGDALPFRSGSFDLVASVDVLEHVPADARPALLQELTRVSSRALLVAAPFRSPDVERAEAFVSTFIAETCGYVQGQLREHRERGLPDLADTVRTLDGLGWHVRTFPYGNLWRWVLMMVDKHAVSALAGSRRLQVRLDRHYNERWFDQDREPPCYRHFIVAMRSDADPMIAYAATRFGASPFVNGSGAEQAAQDPADSARVFELLKIHAANQTLQARLEPARRDAHVVEVEEHRRQAFEAIASLEAERRRLEVLLHAVERSPLYRFRRTLLRWFNLGR
jgi:hypothetical protein